MSDIESQIRALQEALKFIVDNNDGPLQIFRNDCNKLKDNPERAVLALEVARKFIAGELQCYESFYRAAQALNSPDGRRVIESLIDIYYLQNVTTYKMKLDVICRIPGIPF